jgi:hypothetical protein
MCRWKKIDTCDVKILTSSLLCWCSSQTRYLFVLQGVHEIRVYFIIMQIANSFFEVQACSVVLQILLLYRALGLEVILPRHALAHYSIIPIADHSGSAIQDMNCLRSLERWDRGFESHGMYVFVLFCVCIAALRRADLPSKESYRLCTYCGVFTPCKNCNIETRSRDYATVDEAVFSPCRAEQLLILG